MDALSVIQPTVLKHGREQKAPTLSTIQLPAEEVMPMLHKVTETRHYYCCNQIL